MYRIPIGIAPATKSSLQAGDLLFNNTNSRDLVGKIALIHKNMEAGFSNHMTRIRLDSSRCEPLFLVFYMRQLWLDGYFRDRCTQWVSQAAFGSKLLADVRIPLPPLAEQRRIAGILNRAAHIQRLRARATDHLRSLAPALFVQTFGDPAANPMGWPLARLGDVATVAAGDPAPQEPEAFASDGPLFVRMQDVGRGRLDPALSTSADRLNPAWLSRHRLRLFPENSILIPKSGASINLNHRAMLATAAHVVSHLAVLIPNRARVEPDWLFWWSVHYDPRERAQVTSLPSLKLATLKEAPVPLPPLAEQRRFATVARQAQRMTRAAETATATARALAASLMDRLLNPNPSP